MYVYPKVTVCILALAAPPAAAQHHEGDMLVGHTGTGQLRIEFDFDEPIVLPAVSGLLQGWASDEPGFDHLDADEPDFYMLAPGAEIAFEVVAFEPALKAWTPGFADVLDLPGDQYLFPDGHELHGHLDWHIDVLDAAFDPGQTEWQARFRLLDLGATGYLPSDVYTLRFKNVPEPTTAGLFLLGAAVVLWRRRGGL